MIKKTAKLCLVPFKKAIFEIIKRIPTGPLQKTVHIVRSDTIGDFVLFSAVLPSVKKIYPEYKIVLIGDAVWGQLALWLQKNRILGGGESHFDELVAVDGKQYNRNLFYYWRVLKKLRLSAPEIVLHPTFSRTQKSDEWVLICEESQKIGYRGDTTNISPAAKAKNDAQYSRLIENPTSGLEPDRNKHFFNEVAGRQVIQSGLPQWKLPEEELQKGRNFLAAVGVDVAKPVAIVCPNGSEANRTWLAQDFASLMATLHARNNALQFVLIGGPRDIGKCGVIEEILKAQQLKIWNVCAKTTLPQLAQVLAICELYLGAETGSMHMASAVGTSVIVLRWQGHYERFFPYPAWKPGSKNTVVLQKRDESDKERALGEVLLAL
jgi:ADP-heptose:LPS heptosyltransferase